MSTYNDIIQNFVSQAKIIHPPSKEDIIGMECLIIRLPLNQYIDSEYIKNIFEISLEFGTIEHIEKIVHSLNVFEFQYVYIIKFSHINRSSQVFINSCNNLENYGWYDICIFLENNIFKILRIFYDKFIDQHTSCNIVKSSTNVNMEKLLIIQRNYEEFESVIESDINLLENKNNELMQDLADTKKELAAAKQQFDELKDQVKWMNKILYQKINQLELDLRDDFKEFVSSRNRKRNTFIQKM